MTAAELIRQLKGVKKSSAGWVARCPAHDDKHASLSVSEGADGKLLLTCHAGCAFETILASVSHGSNVSSPIIAEYDYVDEGGRLLYQACRTEPKAFFQRKPDSQGGWDYKLNGTRRVLYRLPELLAAAPDRTVAICEGEKDVDRLRSIGAIATTNAGGASKWRGEYNESLRGRKIVILPDNDNAGRKHAQEVAQSLNGIAASVKIVQLPGLPEKGDVSDWLDAGNGIEELRDLAAAAATFEVGATSKRILTNYADFMAHEAPDDEIIGFESCRGEVALIQAVTNNGKSTLTRNGCFCLAAGRRFPPLVPSTTERRVLLLNFEGACGRLQSDLRVMEQVFSEDEKDRIRRNFFPTHAPEIDDEPLSLSKHIEIFKAEAQAIKPDVIFIDTATAAFDIESESDNSEIAALMKTLIRLARDLNCLIVIVHHIGKAKAEEGVTREPAHRGRGASASADFASAIFNLEHSPTSNLVTLTCAKRKTGSGENYEVAMKLDQDSRWFSLTSDAPPRPLTKREMVLSILSETDSLPTSGVEQILAGKMSERTVRNHLAELVKDGLVTQPKYGYWKLRSHESGSRQLGNSYKSLPTCLVTDNPESEVGNLGNPL
jgi:DNA-binding transcriptional ArsR family regulator